jgi:hypothetical protein
MKTQETTEKMKGAKKPEQKKVSAPQRPKQDVKARPTSKPQTKTR